MLALLLSALTGTSVWFPGPARAVGNSLESASTTKPAAAPAVKKLTVEQFDQARKAKDAVVLDVRSPEEYAAGHVPGAVNVPVAGKGSAEFDKTVAAIDRDKPVLVHCRSGVRSAKAVEKMRAMGFANLAEFGGGWVAWQEAGKPTEQGGHKERGIKEPRP